MVVHSTRYEPGPSGVSGVATIRLLSFGSGRPWATVPPPTSFTTSELPSNLTRWVNVPDTSVTGAVTVDPLAGVGVSSWAWARTSTGSDDGEHDRDDGRRCNAPDRELKHHQSESTKRDRNPPRIAHLARSLQQSLSPSSSCRSEALRSFEWISRGRRRPNPEVTRAHARPRGRIQRPASCQRPARRRRRGPSRTGRRGQPLVRRRLQARGGGQDRLRAPLRARDVPGEPSRGQGRAHRAGPGRRRDDERLDLARSDELLRDAAGPSARPGAVARGGPDGHPARRPEPGEPGQPARGGEEREALVVRQPAVRLVPGEAPGPPVPGGAPLSPLDDRLDGRSRRGLARGRQRVLPHLLRAEQRGAVGRRRRRDCGRPGRRRAIFRRHPGQPGHPGAGRPDVAADARWGASARRSSTASRCHASTSASAPRSSATSGSMHSTSPARSCRAARAAGSTAVWSARSGSPRTSPCSRSASSAAGRSRRAGRRSGPECRWHAWRRP